MPLQIITVFGAIFFGGVYVMALRRVQRIAEVHFLPDFRALCEQYTMPHRATQFFIWRTRRPWLDDAQLRRSIYSARALSLLTVAAVGALLVVTTLGLFTS